MDAESRSRSDSNSNSNSSSGNTSGAASFSAFVRIMSGTVELLRTPIVTGRPAVTDGVSDGRNGGGSGGGGAIAVNAASAGDAANADQEEELSGDLMFGSSSLPSSRPGSSTSTSRRGSVSGEDEVARVRWEWEKLVVLELDPLLLPTSDVVAEFWRGGVLRNSLVAKCRLSLREEDTAAALSSSGKKKNMGRRRTRTRTRTRNENSTTPIITGHAMR